MNNALHTAFILCVSLLAIGSYHPSNAIPAPTAKDGGKGNIIWQEDFNGALNESNWNYIHGDGCSIGLCGWGNGETEWYDKPNVESGVQGNLKITAKRDRPGGKFSSGRIDTKGKFSFTYGRIDVRTKLPDNDGAFPAIWMLPSDSAYGAWPKSGEIDIAEFQSLWVKQKGGSGTPSTLHFQNHFGGNALSYWGNGGKASDWHVFSILWHKDRIEFLLDDKKTGEYKPPSLTNPDDWPYNKPFYVIVNLAMEPSWGTKVPNNLNSFELLVDWIRVSKLDE